MVGETPGPVLGGVLAAGPVEPVAAPAETLRSLLAEPHAAVRATERIAAIWTILGRMVASSFS
jgi:hypothetical protein